MKEPYATTLEEKIIKQLKIQAVEEKKYANEIIEEALKDYFKKKKKEVQ